MGKGGGGKKGGGGVGQEIVTYVYYSSFAVAFCEGPVDDIVRIWADSNLIFDKTGKDSLMQGVRVSLERYFGTEDQLPSTTIEAAEGVGNVPAFRGLCYAVFNDLELTEFGNRLPDITAEITRNAKRTVYFAQFDAGYETYRSRRIDPIRKRIYGVDTETADGNGPYLRIHNLETGQLVTSVPNFTVPSNGGGVRAPILVAACDYGYLYASKLDTFSSFPVYKFDAATGQLLGESKKIYIPWEAVPFYPFDRTMLFVLQGLGYTANSRWSLIDTGEMTVVHEGTGGLGTHPSPDRLTVIPGAPFEVERQNFTAKVATALFLAQRNSQATPHTLVEVVRMIVNTEFKATMSGEVKREYKGYSAEPVVSITAADLVPFFPDIPTDGSIGFDVTSMIFDWADYTLILFVDVTGYQDIQIKVDQNSEIVWAKTDLSSPVRGGLSRETDIYVSGSYSYLTGNSGEFLHVVDTISGTKRVFTRNAAEGGFTTEALPEDQIGASNPNIQADLYDGRLNAVIDYTDRTIGVAYLDRVGNEPVALTGVLQDVVGRVGVSPVDIDTSQVDTELVRGYVVRRSTTARSVLEQLASVYLFDVVETDGRLRFATRGQTPLVTIPQRDLVSPADSQDGSGADYWKTTRIQEVELPSQVGIKYVDFDADYHTGYQLDKRQVEPNPTMSSSQQNNIEVPIVMTSTEARQMAARILYNSWVERDLYETRLPTKYLRLDPTDVVNVAMDDGTVYTARIAKMDIGADYSVNVALVSEDVAAYTSNIQGGTNLGWKPQILTTEDPGELYLLDLPLLVDADSDGTRSLPLYWVGSAISDNWPGGILFEIDTDIGVPTPVGLTKFDTPVGFVTGPLPSWDRPFSPDTENAITVLMDERYPRLTTVTNAELLAGANMFAVGDEIIQFRDVIVNADGSMTCSYLLRGRRGTDYVTRAGNTERMLISLKTAPPRFYRTVEGATGDFSYTLYTQNSQDTLPSQPKAWNMRPLRPWSPVHFRRSFDGTDLTLTWIRRTRTNGGWLDAVGTVPLNEETEAYEVYLLAAPYDPATFVRAFLDLTAPSLTYTAADMAADGFDPTIQTLYLVGFQVSMAVGRGFAGPHVVHA